jgi:hypothetical protein
MLDLLFLLILTLAAAGYGLRLLDAFGPRPTPVLDAFALALPLGLGTIALGVLGLGEVGVLNRWVLALLLAPGCGLSAWACFSFTALTRLVPPAPTLPRKEGGSSEDRRLGREGEPSSLPNCEGGLSCEIRPRETRSTFFDRLMTSALAATLIGSLLTALAPVTDGDALCYHLQVPKVFLARGAVFFDPDLHETVYPLLTELLYAVALACRGPVACRLVQWLLGLVFAVAVTALARPSLGSRAWWAGAIAVLTPAVSNGMGAPLNDVALAAFGTSAIVAWARFQREPTTRAALLAGVLAGLALGVKYPALVLTGLLGLTIAARRLGAYRGKRQLVPALRNAARWSLAFGLAAVVVGGAWYFRAWVHTGNPVFPFFRHVFGGAGLDEVLDPIKRPMPVTLWNLLTALGPLTLRPDRFDSFSHQFGPVFLLFLPALLLERAPRRVAAIAALGYAFLALCLTQRQSMRFVLIAVGPMSVGVAWLATRWVERRSLACRVLIGVLLAALGMEAGLALARARQGIGVVLGRESATDYLTRREPTYRVGRWVARNLPPDARIVGQDHRGYYFPCGYTMELAHRRRTGLGQGGEPPDQIVARLREAGFTHLLLCPPVPETAVEFDPTLGRRLAPWLAQRRPLYTERVVDADGVARRYAIYDLAAPITAQAAGSGPGRTRR